MLLPVLPAGCARPTAVRLFRRAKHECCGAARDCPAAVACAVLVSMGGNRSVRRTAQVASGAGGIPGVRPFDQPMDRVLSDEDRRSAIPPQKAGSLLRMDGDLLADCGWNDRARCKPDCGWHPRCDGGDRLRSFLRATVADRVEAGVMGVCNLQAKVALRCHHAAVVHAVPTAACRQCCHSMAHRSIGKRSQRRQVSPGDQQQGEHQRDSDLSQLPHLFSL